MPVITPGRPAYQQVADDIRQQISAGELPVGDPVPSTTQLMARYGVSSTVVRRAIDQLRTEGLVVGHAGKAVYVQRAPTVGSAGPETADKNALAEVNAKLDALIQRVEALERDVRHD